MKENAKEKIYHSIIQLLDTCPYEKLTISQICKHANISRQAFYLYYKNKDDVIKETCIHILENNYLSKIDNEFYLHSNEFLENIVNIYDEHSQLFISMKRWYVLDYLTKNNQKLLQQASKEKFKDSYIKKYSQYYLFSILTPIHSICISWLSNGKKESKEELKEIISRFVLNK